MFLPFFVNEIYAIMLCIWKLMEKGRHPISDSRPFRLKAVSSCDMVDTGY